MKASEALRDYYRAQAAGWEEVERRVAEIEAQIVGVPERVRGLLEALDEVPAKLAEELDKQRR